MLKIVNNGEVIHEQYKENFDKVHNDSFHHMQFVDGSGFGIRVHFDFAQDYRLGQSIKKHTKC